MRKSVKLCILFGVLLAVCAAAFAVSRREEKKEQIKNSGEVVLAIPADSVTALSWENEDGSFAFTKDETGWKYDEDAAFPVDGEKIGEMLAQFEAFTAAFVIEDVEDFAQYGLEEPVASIAITADETQYTLTLGAFSQMDAQRYVAPGDGRVYLVEHDPLEEFDAVLRDMVLDDVIMKFDRAESLRFSGMEDYSITRDEAADSICPDDVYFVDGAPLDTELVEDYLSALRTLKLTDYVSYNVTDEELASFGLDTPELCVALDYSLLGEEENDEGETVQTVTETGSLTISLSRNPEELSAYREAVENEEDTLPSVTCYARLNESQLVYEITQSEFEALTAVSRDTLRHQTLFTAYFDTVTAIDVTLEGEQVSFVCNKPDEESEEDAEETWTWEETEFDISALRSALRALTADSFTGETPEGQEEISLCVHLDNESFPTFTLTLYRYDAESCLAAVDGEPTAFVPRSQMLDLAEAVRGVLLAQ